LTYGKANENLMARGGCLCGGVRYQVNGSLRDVIVCHCSRCRRTHGHVGAYASCDESDLVLVSSSSLRWYEADERRRGFCSDCGASLFWQANGHKTISIAAGTLEPPTGLRTVAQIFAGEPGDYYQALGEGVIHEHGSQPDGTA